MTAIKATTAPAPRRVGSRCSTSPTSRTTRTARDAGDTGAHVDVATAFRIATTGGADLIGANVGLLTPRRSSDAIAVRVPDVTQSADDGVGNPFQERVVRLAGPDDFTHVWVAGVDVTPAMR